MVIFYFINISKILSLKLLILNSFNINLEEENYFFFLHQFIISYLKLKSPEILLHFPLKEIIFYLFG
jgi:hypothetical protein